MISTLAKLNHFLPAVSKDIALLFFRVTVGAAFIFHGYPKITNAFGWMGDSVPGLLQAFAAVSEFGGGIALVLGLLTPLASLGIVGTMVGAMAMVHIPAGHPFVDPMGGHSSELALVYLTAALITGTQGAGRFSIDSLLGAVPNTDRATEATAL